MLEQLLFPAPSCKPGARRYAEPEWAALVREMKRPGVNLSILFEEYQAVHPEGYGYSARAGGNRHLRPIITAT